MTNPKKYFCLILNQLGLELKYQEGIAYLVLLICTGSILNLYYFSDPSGDDQPPAPRAPRTLAKHFYEIPWAYEAREFLRTRCIGKKVNVSVDYIQPKSDKFEEKICATVTINGM